MYSVCYEVECDKNKKQTKLLIGNSYITCPTNGSILNNPNGFKGQIKCPDYNLICTSKIWCNELFDCINKKSEADLETYDYDKFVIENEDSDENNKSLNLKLNIIYFVFLYILF